jgi:hypothetical protein
MPGYTKRQLDGKGAKLSNYILCENCELYWRKRAFNKHLNPPAKPPGGATRPVAIIHPAWAQLFNWAAQSMVEKVKERAQRVRRGETVEELQAEVSGAPVEVSSDSPEFITVEEAVARFGQRRRRRRSRAAPTIGASAVGLCRLISTLTTAPAQSEKERERCRRGPENHPEHLDPGVVFPRREFLTLLSLGLVGRRA